jgi:Cu+-exporting ATPase
MQIRLMVLVASLLVVLLATGCAQAATVSPDGRQSIEVSSQDTFEPSATAKAGQPIRLEFGPGGGCTAAVKFDQLGIYEDLTDGGGTVDLPALDPGQYPLICQSDMVMGLLVVE